MATKTTDPAAVFTDAVIAGVKQSQEVAFSGISLWMDFAGKAFTLPELESVPFVDHRFAVRAIPWKTTPVSAYWILSLIGFTSAAMASPPCGVSTVPHERRSLCDDATELSCVPAMQMVGVAALAEPR